MNDRIYYSQEAARHARRQSTIMALFVLCMGVGIGTVVSMLFAPQAGENTRAALSEQAGQTFEGIVNEMARLRRDVEERLVKS